LVPLESWQLYYFRNGSWSPAVGADALGGLTPLPDGVRLVLSLPPGPSLTGLLTRDWLRPTLSTPKT
jgi:general secretion pathway protein J